MYLTSMLQPPASLNSTASAGGSSSANGVRGLNLGGHVGFDSLPDQVSLVKPQLRRHF